MSREVAVLGAARRMGWARVDTPGAKLTVLAVIVAVAVEAAYRLLGWPPALIAGGLGVSPSCVPLAVAGLASGARTLGRARSEPSRRTFWVLVILVLSVGVGSLASLRSPLTVGSLVVSGFVEELMYRGAIPAVAALGLSLAGVRPRRAGLTGMVVGGATFVVLPGHVAQWDSPAHVVPFVAFALLAGLAVWRSGALIEMAVLHGVINIVNIGRLDGSDEPASSILLVGITLVFVIAYVPPGRRRDLVIDLTDHQRPSVRREHAGSPEPDPRRAGHRSESGKPAGAPGGAGDSIRVAPSAGSLRRTGRREPGRRPRASGDHPAPARPHGGRPRR